MDEGAWYIVAVPLILGLAAGNATLDRWLYNLPRPLSRRAEVAVFFRWAFIAWVLVYAFLIDSHRVAYAEPAIWVLGATGGILTLVLALVACRR